MQIRITRSQRLLAFLAVSVLALCLAPSVKHGQTKTVAENPVFMPTVTTPVNVQGDARILGCDTVAWAVTQSSNQPAGDAPVGSIGSESNITGPRFWPESTRLEVSSLVSYLNHSGSNVLTTSSIDQVAGADFALGGEGFIGWGGHSVSLRVKINGEWTEVVRFETSPGGYVWKSSSEFLPFISVFERFESGNLSVQSNQTIRADQSGGVPLDYSIGGRAYHFDPLRTRPLSLVLSTEPGSPFAECFEAQWVHEAKSALGLGQSSFMWWSHRVGRVGTPVLGTGIYGSEGYYQTEKPCSAGPVENYPEIGYVHPYEWIYRIIQSRKRVPVGTIYTGVLDQQYDGSKFPDRVIDELGYKPMFGGWSGFKVGNRQTLNMYFTAMQVALNARDQQTRLGGLKTPLSKWFAGESCEALAEFSNGERLYASSTVEDLVSASGILRRAVSSRPMPFGRAPFSDEDVEKLLALVVTMNPMPQK